MRLWLSRGSEVSVRDQLVTQVMLSILSGDLRPGQRLPSTRELARRFHVHANTVSAGYRQLQRDGWVEFRKGSGIYVKQQKTQTGDTSLDQLAAEFFSRARKLGTPLSEVRSRVKQWLEAQPPDHLLLIEPDAQLAKIITAELQSNLRLGVQSCAPAEYRSHPSFETAIPLVLSISANQISKSLVPRREIVTLQLRSAADSLAPYLPVPKDALVAVASGWPPFVKTARTMLVAAGFHADSLIIRDATKLNWQRGLEEASGIVCDSLLARSLDGRPGVLVFKLLAESSVEDVKNYEEYLSGS